MYKILYIYILYAYTPHPFYADIKYKIQLDLEIYLFTNFRLYRTIINEKINKIISLLVYKSSFVVQIVEHVYFCLSIQIIICIN